MDMKLEKLKNEVTNLVAKIIDNEVTNEDLQEELFKIAGEIDNIREYHEDKKYSIIKLLQG